MKQVFFLIIIILWSILQARRKAVREQKRREQNFTPAAGTSVPLGAVIEQENKQLVERQTPAMEVSDRWKDMTEDADRFVYSQATDIPAEIRPFIAASRSARRAPVAALDDEVVDRLVAAPVATVQDAYSQTVVVRRGISFDRESMRTFFITREALGPPRSRRPFRPGLRGRE